MRLCAVDTLELLELSINTHKNNNLQLQGPLECEWSSLEFPTPLNSSPTPHLVGVAIDGKQSVFAEGLVNSNPYGGRWLLP